MSLDASINAQCVAALDGFEDDLSKAIRKLESSAGRTVNDDANIMCVSSLLRGALASVQRIRRAR